MQEQENSPKLNISQKSAARIKKLRQNQLDPDSLFDRIIKGDKAALSQAITSVESHSQKHAKLVTKLIENCLPRANDSVRIGITGVPGVGKSTFIESFGNYLIDRGKKVAVLAVDPTSSISKGSILGDKTRMAELVKRDNAFIRPTASGESLGGVARKTRESIILCEAAGYDTILIETVGVGQSETVVHSMSDFFLLLKIAGAGDELQGIKRGIMEMADAIVINKADGDNKRATRQAKSEFKKALHLYPERANDWKPQVKTCSSLYHKGLESIQSMIESFFDLTKKNGAFQQKRIDQNKYWLTQTINQELKNQFYSRPDIQEGLEKELKAIENRETTPFHAAKKLLQL